jgi:hypothetical protein
MTREPDSALRRLDDRWVPRAAAAMHRVLQRLRTPTRRPAALLLRYAVRDEPALAGSIAAVLVAGVLLGTVGEAGPHGNDNNSRPFSPGHLAAISTIGPTPGMSVASYLTKAAFDLRHFGEVGHGGETYALVDLRSYERPSQLMGAFSRLEVVRVYVKVRAGHLPTLVRSVPLNDINDVPAGLKTAATVAASTAKSYGVLLHDLHPRTPADKTVKSRYAEQRRASLREATALDHPMTCACVFALIVRATFVELAAVDGVPGVRAVDPAPPAVEITGLTALPLLPEVTRTVPRTGLPGG